MEDKSIVTEQVEWNLSSAIIAEIQNLLNKANNLYLLGNLPKAFWSLKAVKFRFIQSLDSKERKKLRELEKDFLIAQRNNERGSMAYYYEEYTEQIMDLLESYGYLIPKKKDSHRIS